MFGVVSADGFYRKTGVWKHMIFSFCIEFF
nr:MAG TPA: hypothetical protein [Bacteriophage sp.]